MKTTKNIVALPLLLMAFVSCNNNSIVEKEVIELSLPEHGYILFNTGVDSRGALIENELTENFHVLGYRYSSTWETAKVQAKPEVFYKEDIEYRNGVHTYDPMQPWIGTQKYAFFAYYPISDKLNASAETYEGNPYVEYTLASRTNPGDLKDVMTAHVIDTDASARTVDFTMKHRLSAIDVIGRNFNNEEKSVAVSNLVIKFDNLLYDKVTIPLNFKDEPELVVGDKLTGNAMKATYPLISNSTFTIPFGGAETLLSEGKTMIVIPQDTYLKGKYDITFRNEGGVEVTKIDQAFDMTCSILSGRRYYIQLTFTQEDITVAIIQSEEWADEKIDHEFE